MSPLLVVHPGPPWSPQLHLTTAFEAFTTVQTAFATFFAKEAAAKNSQTREQPLVESSISLGLPRSLTSQSSIHGLSFLSLLLVEVVVDAASGENVSIYFA